METRTSHHCGPCSARRSRSRFSCHVLLGGFFRRRAGSWMSRSCTSSFQSLARSSRLSLRCYLLSRPVSSPSPPSAEADADIDTDIGGEGVARGAASKERIRQAHGFFLRERREGSLDFRRAARSKTIRKKFPQKND
ncbi:hypothetical protein ABZP36_005040 [Zizania latifolia]